MSVGDAWTMGSSTSFKNLEALKCLGHPRRFIDYVYKGIEYTYANSCVSSLSRAIYLPKPIYRYWSLFPANYLEKCEKHAEMFSLQELRKDAETLKNHIDNPAFFWKKAAEIRRKDLGFHYPDELDVCGWEDHPRIMKGLLSDFNSQSYQIREEVLDLIKNL